MALVFDARIRLPDCTIQCVAGQTVAKGCAAVATGTWAITKGAVDNPAGADSRVDFIAIDDIADTSGGRAWSLGDGMVMVKVAGAVNLHDRLNVRDVQGRFGPVGGMDTTAVLVALEGAANADEFVRARPIYEE